MFAQTVTVKFELGSIDVSFSFASSKLGSFDPVMLIRMPPASTTVVDLVRDIEFGTSQVDDAWRPDDEQRVGNPKVIILGGAERQRVLAFALREFGFEVE